MNTLIIIMAIFTGLLMLSAIIYIAYCWTKESKIGKGHNHKEKWRYK